MAALYVYQPLIGAKAIRVLRLNRDGDPSSPTQGIVATLEHIDLDDLERPQYEPVSYVWAGPHSVPSWLPGSTAHDRAGLRNTPLLTTCGRQLMISPSLRDALPHLIGASTSGRFWIDQVCINQEDRPEDLLERSQQVAMMHLVYAGGCRTLVWLCEGHEDFTSLNKVIATHGGEHLRGLSRSECYDRLAAHCKDGTIESSQVQSAIYRLMSCSWFTRTWIQQEAFHSTSVLFICGDERFLPEDILMMSEWILGHDTRFDWSPRAVPVFRGQQFIRNIVFRNILLSHGDPVDRKSKLSDYLSRRVLGHTLGDTLVSDPRDLVYAVLNICEPGTTIEPNYSASVAEVFAKATRYLFDANNDLRILEICDGGRELSGPRDPRATIFADPALCKALPSWVMNFSRKSRLSPMHSSLLSLAPSPFSAGMRYGLIQAASSNWDRLPMKGKVIDGINLIDAEYDIQNLTGELKALQPYSLHLAQVTSRLNDSIEAAQLHSAEPCSAIRLARVLYHGKAMVRNGGLGYGEEIEKLVPNHFDGSDRVREILSVDGMLKYRRYFMSDQGRLGLAPASIETGDVIAICHGATTPFALRLEQDETYSFVGACYLEDCMEGEAVTWAEDEADEIILV